MESAPASQDRTYRTPLEKRRYLVVEGRIVALFGARIIWWTPRREVPSMGCGLDRPAGGPWRFTLMRGG